MAMIMAIIGIVFIIAPFFYFSIDAPQLFFVVMVSIFGWLSIYRHYKQKYNDFRRKSFLRWLLGI